MPTPVDDAERAASLLRTYADRFDHGHAPPSSDHLAMDAHALWRARGGCPRYLTAAAASSLAGVALDDMQTLTATELLERTTYAMIQGKILARVLLGKTSLSLPFLRGVLDSVGDGLSSAVLDRLRRHGFEVTADEISWTNSNGT